MRQIPTSPFPSGGRNPVAEAVSSDNTNLYVVNEDDNTIVQFIIGSDGKLYPQNTVNTPGVFPMAVSVAKSYLFVADTYQPLATCSPASPCSGSVAVFPIQPAAGSTPCGTLRHPHHDQHLQWAGVCYRCRFPAAGQRRSYANRQSTLRPMAAYLFVSAVDTTSKTGLSVRLQPGHD